MQFISDHLKLPPQSKQQFTDTISPTAIQSIKQKILNDIYDQFTKQYQHQAAQLEQKAKLEYQEAFAELHMESQTLKKQKAHTIQKQIGKLRRQNEQKSNQRYQRLYQEYLGSNFEDKILNSQKIDQLQHTIREEVKKNWKSKFMQELERKKREVLVRIENNNKKEMGKRDMNIKCRIEGQCDLDNKKKDINIAKVNLGSLKSQYNLKIYKLNQEIKLVNEHLNHHRSIYQDQDVSLLKEELMTLQLNIKSKSETILTNPQCKHSHTPKQHLQSQDPLQKYLRSAKEIPNNQLTTQNESSSILPFEYPDFIHQISHCDDSLELGKSNEQQFNEIKTELRTNQPQSIQHLLRMPHQPLPQKQNRMKGYNCTIKNHRKSHIGFQSQKQRTNKLSTSAKRIIIKGMADLIELE